MPKAILMNKHDILGSGKTVFENTGVTYADDGINGLLHNIPMSQQDWIHDGVHALSYSFDATTARLPARMTAAGAGNGFLRKRLLLPRDFGRWPNNAIKLITRRSAIISGSLLFTMYGPSGSADPDVNAINVTPVSADTYEQFVITPGGVYAQSDFMTAALELEFIAANPGDWMEISDVEVTIRSAEGNI
jgi:hypothetical protein